TAGAGAAGRDRFVDRRRADFVSRRAEPRRGRSRGAAGAPGSPRLAFRRPGQRRAAAHRARRRRAAPRAPRPRGPPPPPGAARVAPLAARPLAAPPGLMQRGIKNYGEAPAHAIAAANGREPALDLTVKSDAVGWAEKLGGRVLPTGSVRTLAPGAITALPGFDEGAWWVQDAAASIPARL